jgi:hypothetical protein
MLSKMLSKIDGRIWAVPGKGRLRGSREAEILQKSSSSQTHPPLTASICSLDKPTFPDSTGPNGGPRNLLASTGASSVSAGWVTIPAPRINLAAANYWLAYEVSDSNAVFGNSTAGSNEIVWSNESFGSIPSVFPSFVGTKANQAGVVYLCRRFDGPTVMTTHTHLRFLWLPIRVTETVPDSDFVPTKWSKETLRPSPTRISP